MIGRRLISQIAVYLMIGFLMQLHPLAYAVENAGGRIVFRLGGNLWTMNPDGSNKQDLGVKGDYPKWSPDGKQIVFHRWRDHLRPPHIEIFVVNADGSNLRQLTQVPREAQVTIQDRYPAWSLDGQSIAFVSNRDGNAEIYLMDAFGENLINLTNSPQTYEVMPAWSPNGEKIVYVANGHLYTIHLKNKGKQRLTDTVTDRWGPVWSPDGMQIAFFSPGDGNFDIFTIDADGKNLRPLTNHPANDTNPTWSPDGTQIVFQSDRDGSNNLYRLSIASGEIKPLTNSFWYVGEADWSRIPHNLTAVRPTRRKLVMWGKLKAKGISQLD